LIVRGEKGEGGGEKKEGRGGLYFNDCAWPPRRSSASPARLTKRIEEGKRKKERVFYQFYLVPRRKRGRGGRGRRGGEVPYTIFWIVSFHVRPREKKERKKKREKESAYLQGRVTYSSGTRTKGRKGGGGERENPHLPISRLKKKGEEARGKKGERRKKEGKNRSLGTIF